MNFKCKVSNAKCQMQMVQIGFIKNHLLPNYWESWHWMTDKWIFMDWSEIQHCKLNLKMQHMQENPISVP